MPYGKKQVSTSYFKFFCKLVQTGNFTKFQSFSARKLQNENKKLILAIISVLPHNIFILMIIFTNNSWTAMLLSSMSHFTSCGGNICPQKIEITQFTSTLETYMMLTEWWKSRYVYGKQCYIKSAVIGIYAVVVFVSEISLFWLLIRQQIVRTKKPHAHAVSKKFLCMCMLQVKIKVRLKILNLGWFLISLMWYGCILYISHIKLCTVAMFKVHKIARSAHDRSPCCIRFLAMSCFLYGWLQVLVAMVKLMVIGRRRK